MNFFTAKNLILILSFSLCLNNSTYAEVINKYVGINLAGAEFNSSTLPGKQGTNYLWPTPAEINQYGDAGFNTIRVPFRWERMQPTLNESLNETEAGYLDSIIDTAKKRNITIIIDPHNYGSYKNSLIGSENVPNNAFSNFWSRLAERYKKYPNVMFGLMNEPNKQSAEEWAEIAQSTIYAIRKTGAKQVILVPGTRWSGAHSWLSKSGNLSNAEALKNIHDPAENIIFELHQYFDSNSSGTKPECVSEEIGAQRLKASTEWMRANHRKGLLGEFGASVDPVCLQALNKTLEYMQKNSDVWVGWTYWAAGKWFGKYMFNIYPPDLNSSKQLQVITPYLPNR